MCNHKHNIFNIISMTSLIIYAGLTIRLRLTMLRLYGLNFSDQRESLVLYGMAGVGMMSFAYCCRYHVETVFVVFCVAFLVAFGYLYSVERRRENSSPMSRLPNNNVSSGCSGGNTSNTISSSDTTKRRRNQILKEIKTATNKIKH